MLMLGVNGDPLCGFKVLVGVPVQWKPCLLCALLYSWSQLNGCLLGCEPVYPMGKHTLILKGSTCNSAILVADVKGLYLTCSYCEEYFYVYTLYCTVRYFTTGCHAGVKVMCVRL